LRAGGARGACARAPRALVGSRHRRRRDRTGSEASADWPRREPRRGAGQGRSRVRGVRVELPSRLPAPRSAGGGRLAAAAPAAPQALKGRFTCGGLPVSGCGEGGHHLKTPLVAIAVSLAAAACSLGVRKDATPPIAPDAV